MELLERRNDLFEKALELAGLVPRGHAQGDMLDAGIEVAFELVDALFRTARGGEEVVPAFK